MKQFPIVAVEVRDDDCGFNVAYDRKYNILEERFPITDEAAMKAIDDAWDWGWDPRELEEMEQVGILYTDDDGNYIKTECTM